MKNLSKALIVGTLVGDIKAQGEERDARYYWDNYNVAPDTDMSIYDFQGVFRAHEKGATDDQVREAFDWVDADKSNSLSWKEFESFYSAEVPEAPEREAEEEPKRDDKRDRKWTKKDTSGKPENKRFWDKWFWDNYVEGFTMGYEEYSNIYRSQQPDASEDEIRKGWEKGDVDGSGTMSFGEWRVQWRDALEEPDTSERGDAGHHEWNGDHEGEEHHSDDGDFDVSLLEDIQSFVDRDTDEIEFEGHSLERGETNRLIIEEVDGEPKIQI